MFIAIRKNININTCKASQIFHKAPASEWDCKYHINIKKNHPVIANQYILKREILRGQPACLGFKKVVEENAPEISTFRYFSEVQG